MHVWHLTPDAPREPSRVPPGSPANLRVGTWPVEPGQEVIVEFSVTPWAGGTAGGRVRAQWVENRGENSYWTATFGPFTDGDRVSYRMVGSVQGETTFTEWILFTVRPAVHLALLWHHHQPLYREHVRVLDPVAVTSGTGQHAFIRCDPPDPVTNADWNDRFRHRALSDAIGFHYQGVPDPEQAAQTFVAGVKDLARGLIGGERDHLLSVILDGGNAWGSYRDDGRPFLHALYRALESDSQIKTVTISEYLEGNPARRVPPHPTPEQTRVYNLFTGRWIDEFGSAPGVDLGTWIGEPEENEAWRLLGEVRHALEKAGATPASHPEAYRALYAAEGSDWFWWYGSDHQSDADETFDDLFRNHLKAACGLAGVEDPTGLDRHIVPHRVIWTFTAPVSEIEVGDQLIVRTNQGLWPGA